MTADEFGSAGGGAEPLRDSGHPRGVDLDAPPSLGNARMLEDLTRPTTTPRGTDGRPGPASARPAPAASIQGLRWLRERVLERLDALEAMARRREASPAAGDLAALERTLQQRLAEVEEARRQLRAEAERQREEWSASLARPEPPPRAVAEAETIPRERDERLRFQALRQHLLDIHQREEQERKQKQLIPRLSRLWSRTGPR